MIKNIEISGNNFDITPSFQKYAEKRIGKLDKFLPRESKKDALVNIVVTKVEKAHNNKYSIAINMELIGGHTIAAKDECGNVFAGIDLLEAKLKGQIRRYKLESTPHLRRLSLKNLFIKRR